MQVEDSLRLDKQYHKCIELCKEVHDPFHVDRPVEEKHESDRVYPGTIHRDYSETHKRNQLAGVVHAHFEPGSAAVMSDEVNCCFIE